MGSEKSVRKGLKPFEPSFFRLSRVSVALGSLSGFTTFAFQMQTPGQRVFLASSFEPLISKLDQWFLLEPLIDTHER
jgi:hypothetical protein